MERNWVIVSKAEFREMFLGLTYNIENLAIYIFLSCLQKTMLSALSSLESEGSGKIDVAKAEELLAKADDEMSIRATVADLLQKNNAHM